MLSIKGQNYCLNCGSEVKAGRLKPAPRKSASVAAKVSVKPPAKKATGSLKPAVKMGELGSGDVQELAKHALQIPFRHHLHWTGVTADMLLAIFLFFPVLLLATFQIGYGGLRHELLLLGVGAVWLALGLMVLVLRLWSASALTFGLSKRLDHRPTPVRQWHTAGRRYLIEILTLRLIQSLVLAVLALLEFGVLTASALLPPGLGLPVAFAATLILVGAATTAILLPALARPAILVGSVGVGAGLAYASSALRHKTRTLFSAGGYGLMSATILVAGLSVMMVSLGRAVSSGFWQLPGWVILPVLAAGLVTATLLIHFSLMFTQSLWLLAYQKLSRPSQV